MALGRQGPFGEFLREFYGRGGESSWPSGGYSPPTDVFATEDRVVVRMDLPGVNPDDVDASCQGRTLVVNGRRDFPHGESVRFVQRGTFYGQFTSRVELGERLDLSNVSARYDNGVLEIVIPYVPEEQPRRIQIDSGGG
jgi:HSP20 family protein